MRRINLIPPEARKISTKGWIKKYLFKSRSLRLAMFSVLILVSIFIYQTSVSIRYKIKISQQKINLETLEAELLRSNEEESQIRSLMDVIEQDNKYLQRKLSFLEKVRLEAIGWSQVLLYLSKLTPSDLWLDKICLNNQIITINGMALDNIRVSDFMVRLDESGHFKATSFNFIQKKKDRDERFRNLSVVEFEIATQLVK